MSDEIVSQNGWPAYDTTRNYVRHETNGFAFWAANQDVALIFDEFIRRFDKDVEEITQKTLDDWSYANRLVRGSTSVVSNHGSATAIDLNALQHPRGVKNTFSPNQRDTMHAIRRAITDNDDDPVLRLGMDYTTTVDDMHVEINANARRVREAADKIREARERAENMLNAEDKAWLRATIQSAAETAVENVFKDSKIVPNKPLDAGSPQGANWTPAGVLAASDQKTDLQGRQLSELTQSVQAVQAAQSQILGLLGTLVPAPTPTKKD